MIVDRVTLTKSGIDWPSLYFTAESDGENYEDVRIVTARSVYLYLLEEQALQHVKEITPAAVQSYIVHNLKNYVPHVCEQVTFDGDSITVVIDTDVIDEQAIDTALEMVAQAICKGKRELCFSKPLKFDLRNLPW